MITKFLQKVYKVSPKRLIGLHGQERRTVRQKPLPYYHLPDGKGSEVAATILQEFPKAIILILSMEHDNDIIYQCKTAGVKGYLIKNLSSDELLEAIQESVAGQEIFMWAPEKPTTAKHEDVLSKREKEIIHLITQGLTSHEIAEKLFLSTYTVDTHRRNILRKLDLKNTAMMVLYAQQHQL
jgi:DNA-binding NarL/FixJ family response regulator